MKKVYYLATCDTCKRILKEVGTDGFELREIKSQAISEEELEEMVNRSTSYESLFSRRARKFRELGLHEIELEENDFKKYLLEEYTFLKRPVFLIDEEIYIGNSKKTVDLVKKHLNK